ncbi:hypothetical protein QTP88_025389 [Uroleucon formosanum]
MPCGICDKNISPQKKLVCSKCNYEFHVNCTSIKSMANLKDLGLDDECWNCDTCFDKIHKNVTSRKKNNLFKADEDFTDLKSEIYNLTQNVKKLTDTVGSLKDSVSFCSSKIDDFSIELNKLIKNASEQGGKINILENKILNSENELFSFKTHSNSIEQQKLQSTCKIDRIPKTNNENLLEIISSISNKLNIKMAMMTYAIFLEIKINTKGREKL